MFENHMTLRWALLTGYSFGDKIVALQDGILQARWPALLPQRPGSPEIRSVSLVPWLWAPAPETECVTYMVGLRGRLSTDALGSSPRPHPVFPLPQLDVSNAPPDMLPGGSVVPAF